MKSEESQWKIPPPHPRSLCSNPIIAPPPHPIIKLCKNVPSFRFLTLLRDVQSADNYEADKAGEKKNRFWDSFLSFYESLLDCLLLLLLLLLLLGWKSSKTKILFAQRNDLLLAGMWKERRRNKREWKTRSKQASKLMTMNMWSRLSGPYFRSYLVSRGPETLLSVGQCLDMSEVKWTSRESEPEKCPTALIQNQKLHQQHFVKQNEASEFFGACGKVFPISTNTTAKSYPKIQYNFRSFFSSLSAASVVLVKSAVCVCVTTTTTEENPNFFFFSFSIFMASAHKEFSSHLSDLFRVLGTCRREWNLRFVSQSLWHTHTHTHTHTFPMLYFVVKLKNIEQEKLYPKRGKSEISFSLSFCLFLFACEKWNTCPKGGCCCLRPHHHVNVKLGNNEKLEEWKKKGEKLFEKLERKFK